VIDACQITYVTPAEPTNPTGFVGFYFGFFGASASWNATTQIGKIAVALAEVAAYISDIFVWYEKNGQAGFQPVLGNDYWDCTAAAAASPPYDCFDPTYTIQLKSLTWSPITATPMSCPTGYNSKCQIYSFSTSGSLNGATVITITLRIASQAVLINNVQVTPQYGEFDITISYPWTTTPGITDPNAHVGLSVGAAGQALALNGQIAQVDGDNALAFQGSASAQYTYFSWDGASTVDSQGSQVYFQGISAAAILAYNCSKCTLIGSVVVAALKLYVGALELTGWKANLISFSWIEPKPTTVFWDPKVGTSASLGTGSGACVSQVSLVFVAGALLLALFNQVRK